METIYICEGCGHRVLPGTGYIHTTREHGRYWAIHHRECYDFSGEVCFAVPRHWADLLTAHADFSRMRKVSA